MSLEVEDARWCLKVDLDLLLSAAASHMGADDVDDVDMMNEFDFCNSSECEGADLSPLLPLYGVPIERNQSVPSSALCVIVRCP